MRRAALLLFPALLAGSLAACSGSTSSSLPTVKGAYGDKPKVTIGKDAVPKPKLETSLLTKGTGPVVKKGDLLVADYLGEVFRTGKVFDNSYDHKSPVAFQIGVGRLIKGWDTALVGVKAGSRVLMVIPPKDGYGPKGNSKIGVKGTDWLVYIVDVIASYGKTGWPEKNAPVTGLPTDLPQVTGAVGAEPQVTVPAGTTPPQKSAVTVLATGTGPAVASGKLAVVEYNAVSWAGKSQGSSWARGPQAVPVGGAQAGPFDLLVGIPAGSRVLMTLPAPTGGDATKDSVAVAVDILGVHGPAAATGK